MHPGLVQHQHPAQHRFPVWWTGDGVNLQASVESMVDSGVYDFKPFVHSDCGGDYRGKVPVTITTNHITLVTVTTNHIVLATIIIIPCISDHASFKYIHP